MIEDDGNVVARSERRAAAAAWHGLLQEQPSSTHASLGRLDVPILLVLATRNPTTDEATRFRELVPCADVLEVESRHDVFADAPEAIAAFVADWLVERLDVS